MKRLQFSGKGKNEGEGRRGEGDGGGGDGGAIVQRRRRHDGGTMAATAWDSGVAVTTVKYLWPGQGVAAVVAVVAAQRRAAAALAVGLLPRPSLRSHLR